MLRGQTYRVTLTPYFPTVSDLSRGRNAGYPAPPAQSRTCGITASGSSVILAFAQDRSIKQAPFGVIPPLCGVS